MVKKYFIPHERFEAGCRCCFGWWFTKYVIPLVSSSSFIKFLCRKQGFIGKWGNKKTRGRPANQLAAKIERNAEREEAAIRLLQRTWRWYRVRIMGKFKYKKKPKRKKLKNLLVVKHKKRTDPVKELLKTETTYFNILTCMVELFLVPIREGKLMDDASIRAIFSNVESILMLNKTLWIETTERVKNWGIDVKIGDIFLRIVKTVFLFSFLFLNNFLKLFFNLISV